MKHCEKQEPQIFLSNSGLCCHRGKRLDQRLHPPASEMKGLNYALAQIPASRTAVIGLLA